MTWRERSAGYNSSCWMICSRRERLRIWSVIAGSRSSIGLRHRRRDVIRRHLLRNHQEQRL